MSAPSPEQEARALGLRCAGCGATVTLEDVAPWSCPQREAQPDCDHLLWPEASPPPPAEVELRWGESPFLRNLDAFAATRLARARGLPDAALRSMVEGLESAVFEVDGRRFRSYAAQSNPALAQAAGLSLGTLLCGNETTQVSGSHKGRHLMGILMLLLVRERLGLQTERAPLAIASCGNAGLAAATLAAAARWPIQVYVPESVDPLVRARLEALGAQLRLCPRRAGERGDPSYLRFREAVAAGAIPFSCQGPDNGLTLEGGMTLGLELAQRCGQLKLELDRVFIQVGGGALLTGVALGLERGLASGLLPRRPKIHAVQTRSAFPLPLAWQRLSLELEALAGAPASEESSSYEDAAAAAREARAALLCTRLQDANSELWVHLRGAATQRGRYMAPWPTEPHSVAHGILDDETYDWHACVKAMLRSGGTPLVVEEAELLEATRLVREHSKVQADATGTAGLAGILRLRTLGLLGDNERCAIVLTGVDRSLEGVWPQTPQG